MGRCWKKFKKKRKKFKGSTTNEVKVSNQTDSLNISGVYNKSVSISMYHRNFPLACVMGDFFNMLMENGGV